jgi:putative sterol carrier protein
MKVFTDDWAKGLKDAINSNKNYKAAASWWEGDFIFVVTPSGNLKKEVKVFVGLYHGACTDARVLKAGEAVKAEYIYAGDYESWVKILKQQLDPIRGLLSGQFKLTGDMAKVLRATKAAQELVVSTTLIKGAEFL